MPPTHNAVRTSFYLDSVALMRLAQAVKETNGVIEAAFMVGTSANLEILAQADLLTEIGRAATPNDLVIAISATEEGALAAATARAHQLLETAAHRATGEGAHRLRSARSLAGALARRPGANLALISVPGEFAALEAHEALARGLDVLLFSNNVGLADEVALKQRAKSRGLLVMGPDCGTAIVGGTPLGFANAVARGPIGIVSASGTGLQELSVLLDRTGLGISHALGVGSRDLDPAVDALSTETAIDLLAGDRLTEHVVVVSKPAEANVAARVLRRLERIGKPAMACFLGLDLPAARAPADVNGEVSGEVRYFNTIERTAIELAARLGAELRPSAPPPDLPRRPGLIRGLYNGGSLCAEAQTVLRDGGLQITSNIPIPNVAAADPGGHCLLDLGTEDYTRGRPHPMLEPVIRSAPIERALHDTRCSVVLLDIVLGYGAHLDPASSVCAALRTVTPEHRPVVIASVCGTEHDPQGLADQRARLERESVVLAPTAASAARWAMAVVS